MDKLALFFGLVFWSMGMLWIVREFIWSPRLRTLYFKRLTFDLDMAYGVILIIWGILLVINCIE